MVTANLIHGVIYLFKLLVSVPGLSQGLYHYLLNLRKQLQHTENRQYHNLVSWPVCTTLFDLNQSSISPSVFPLYVSRCTFSLSSSPSSRSQTWGSGQT